MGAPVGAEPLPADTPPLSRTLPGPRHPLRCGNCCRELRELDPGEPTIAGPYGGKLPPEIPRRWVECDLLDRATNTVLVLCGPCDQQLAPTIEAHPRLYRELQPYQPHPGTMPVCADCRYRDGLRCTSPNARANGGPGVGLDRPPPIHAHFCYGGGKGAWRRFWSEPVRGCRSKEGGG